MTSSPVVAGLVVLVIVLAVLALASANRVKLIRRGGTATLLRSLPSQGGTGWHHGFIRYTEGSLNYYKLTSLRLGPDIKMARGGIELGERRRPEDREHDIMSDEILIVSLVNAGREFEIALDNGAFTAFMSWVESRPSGRSVRGRPGDRGPQSN